MECVLFCIRLPAILPWVLMTIGLCGCGVAQYTSVVAQSSNPTSCTSAIGAFGLDEPENLGVNVQKLVELTEWVEKAKSPFFLSSSQKTEKLFTKTEGNPPPFRKPDPQSVEHRPLRRRGRMLHGLIKLPASFSFRRACDPRACSFDSK